MPYDEADETDPMLLVGVDFPASATADRELTMVFAEEYARLGFDESRIMFLFQNPHYVGAYQAYRKLGEKLVRSLVKEQTNFWGRVRYRDQDTPPATDAPSTPNECSGQQSPCGCSHKRKVDDGTSS